MSFEVTDEPARLIVTERMPYPLERVWVAQTEALYVQQWWSPIGYRNVDISLASNEGGSWRVVQRDPQGNQFSFYGKVESIEPLKHLAITLTTEIFPDTQVKLRQEFAASGKDSGDGTTAETIVVSTYEFESDRVRDAYLNLGGIERLRGASAKLDRLLGELTGQN